MDKRNKRIFMVEIIITVACWDYREGQKLTIPIITNNESNACDKFRDQHSGSEYPEYHINKIIDTAKYGLFMPNIKAKTLLRYF